MTMKGFFRNHGRIFFWEFLQNFPLLLGFTMALNEAKHQAWGLMFLSGFLGSLVGSQMIRFTEPLIVSGEKESVLVTLTNMVVFLITTVAIAVYFAQRWGGWWTDLILGLFIGGGLGYVQDLAAGQKKPGIRHILALMFAFIPALLVIRLLTETFSPLWAALCLNFMVTLVIVLIDYPHLIIQHKEL